MSDGLVDWSLAERIGRAMAGEPDRAPAEPALGPGPVRELCAGAEADVVAYTRLEPAAPAPEPRVVSRGEWVATAALIMRELTAAIERRAGAAIPLPPTLGAIARPLLGAAAGAEAGVAIGYAARRVLGQYDVSLAAAPTRPPSLLFVAPNLAEARTQLDAEAEPLLRWIAAHELTHAVQFAAVPWLRGHLAGLVQELGEAALAELSPGEMRAALGRLLRSDPRETVRTLLQGELPRLLAGPRQRQTLDRVQATMTIVEGHAEHEMDAVGLADRGLRERLEARRGGRGGIGEALARILGLELKLRQYRLGRAFCDAIVARDGVAGLNLVWSSPEALPTPQELERPALWRDRVASRSTV